VHQNLGCEENRVVEDLVENLSGGSKWQKHQSARKGRHVREKATIDHLVQDVYKPKPADEKHPEHGPTTSSGLPVEDQVRKEWDPRKGGLPVF
jgi:hypothetical protein